MTPDAAGPTAVLGERLLAFSEALQAIFEPKPNVGDLPAVAAPVDRASLPPWSLHDGPRRRRALPRRAESGLVLRKRIGGLHAEFHSDPPLRGRLRDLLSGFAPFPCGAPVRIRIGIRRAGAALHIREDDGSEQAADPVSFVPTIKALLTERLLDRGDHLMALHGAVIATPRGATLLVGAPGAGKSTLAAACMGAGLAVRCDDMALLRADGRIAPVPFPLALKPGAWPIVSALLPRLAGQPIHCRPDGRRVRYLPLRGASDRPEAVTRIVLIDRTPAAPSLSPVDPLLALAELLEGAHRPDGRLNAAGFMALTSLVGGSETFVLAGDDARAGAALLAA